MRNIIGIRIAGASGFLLGIFSLVSGSMVLAGIKQPDYTVLNWLVIYNIMMGLVSMAVGLVIWFGQKRGALFAVAISGVHAGVLICLILISAFGSLVAVESMGAMTFRLAVWIAITVALIRQPHFRVKKKTP